MSFIANLKGCIIPILINLYRKCGSGGTKTIFIVSAHEYGLVISVATSTNKAAIFVKLDAPAQCLRVTAL